MDSPAHQRRSIIEYYLLESPEGTEVYDAEKVASERIYGQKHDVWDVHASDGRWWVITNPTNLYPQETAPTPSMDHALSLHIGVTARIFARQALQAPVDGGPIREKVAKSVRRFEQAARALNEAQEAEDFQAVGMRLRECLIAYAQETSGDVTIPEGSESPKRADFKAWARLLVGTIAPGASAKEVRSYLNAMASETWDLVAWLTHAANATRTNAEIALDATRHLLDILTLGLIRAKRGDPLRCEDCGSYQVVHEYRLDEDETTIWDEEFLLCEVCGWEGTLPERHTTTGGLPTAGAENRLS